MPNKIKVRKIAANEVDRAAEVLSEAFETDPLMLWVFGSQDYYKQHSKTVFKTWVHYCLLYGRVYCTEDFGAVAILKAPGYSEISLWRAIRSGMLFNMWSLGKEGWDRLLKFDALSTQQAKLNMHDKEYWYLWMLGTKPSCRKQGLGQALLTEFHESLTKTASPKISCYLDASSEDSVRLYSNEKNKYKKLTFFTIPDATHVKLDCMEKVIEADQTEGTLSYGTSQ